MNISEQVKEIIDNYENGYLELSSGKKSIKFNQKQTVEKIDCYINNTYYDRDDNDAIFWNISNHRITHFAKLLSPDTKDFMPYGLGSLNHFQSWALRKNVTKWFDDEKFYQTLNNVSEGEATYGSQLWKKVEEKGKNKLKEVKLTNVCFDQSVENIEDADGVVERHNLSKKQLRDKIGIWDNDSIDEILDKEAKSRDNIEIWEFAGYANDKYQRVIGYGYGEEYIELWQEELEKCPYVDFHLGKYRGRWLRIGVVERLFQLQARINQLVNQNAEATEIASLLLLKSNQTDMIGNVLEQAVNGQIIPDNSLEQIGISNTGLNQFISEIQLIENQADKLCLTPDIIQGEGSPSNTTFRGIATINSAAVSAFRDYRQNLLEKIADILMEYIFPNVVKSWSHDDVIDMAEDDGDIEEYIKALTSKEEIKYLLGGVGNVVTDDIKKSILKNVEDKVNNEGGKIKIPKDFFNFKWGFKMMPTNETGDKTAKNDAYYNALTMIGANPALVDIPLFKQYLEDNGISSWKLTTEQKEALQNQAGQSGQSGQSGQAKTLPEQKKPDALLSQANPIN